MREAIAFAKNVYARLSGSTRRPFTKSIVSPSGTLVCVIRLFTNKALDSTIIVDLNDFRLISATNEFLPASPDVPYPTVKWKGGKPPFKIKLQWMNPAMGGYMDDDSTGRVVNIDGSLTNGVGDIVTSTEPREYIIKHLIEGEEWWSDDLIPTEQQDAIGLTITDSSAAEKVLFLPFTPTPTFESDGVTKTGLSKLYDHYGPPTWCLPPVEWNEAAPIVYGTALSATQLNATARVPGSVEALPGVFTYTPPLGTVLDATDGTFLSVTFQATDDLHYHEVTAEAGLVISKASQLLTYYNSPSPPFGISNLAKNDFFKLRVFGGGSGNPIIVTSTTPSISITDNGDGTWTGTAVAVGNFQIRVSQAGNTNYLPASEETSLVYVVYMRNVTITWANPTDIEFGVKLTATQLNAFADTDCTFTYDPLAGTLLYVGSRSLTVDAVATDTGNYANSSAEVWLEVVPSTPVLAWTPTNLIYGEPWVVAFAGATAKNPHDTTMNALDYGQNPMSFKLTSTGSVLNPGDVPSAVHGGEFVDMVFVPIAGGSPSVNQYLTNTLANTSVQIDQATPIVSWATPQAMYYGTALSATQLNATANIAGTFVYSPAAGTKPNPSTALTLSVTFTPTDSTNFETVNKTVTLVVNKAPLQVQLDNKTVARYATAPAYTWTVNPSGLQNGDTLAVVSGRPSMTTGLEFWDGAKYVITAAANNYPIYGSVGTLVATNYSFIVLSGTLSVTAAKSPQLAALYLSISTNNAEAGTATTMSWSGGSGTGVYVLSTSNINIVTIPTGTSSGAGSQAITTLIEGACTLFVTKVGDATYESNTASLTLVVKKKTIPVYFEMANGSWANSQLNFKGGGGAYTWSAAGNLTGLVIQSNAGYTDSNRIAVTGWSESMCFQPGAWAMIQDSNDLSNYAVKYYSDWLPLISNFSPRISSCGGIPPGGGGGGNTPAFPMYWSASIINTIIGNGYDSPWLQFLASGFFYFYASQSGFQYILATGFWVWNGVSQRLTLNVTGNDGHNPYYGPAIPLGEVDIFASMSGGSAYAFNYYFPGTSTELQAVAQ